MRPRGAFLCGVLFACASLSAGCAGLARQPSLPDDPLLVSKKPTRGKAQYAPPVMLARAEQTMPPDPTPTLLAASPALRREIGAARELNIVPVNMPRPKSLPTPDDPRRTVTAPVPTIVSPTSGRSDPQGASFVR